MSCANGSFFHIRLRNSPISKTASGPDFVYIFNPFYSTFLLFLTNGSILSTHLAFNAHRSLLFVLIVCKKRDKEKKSRPKFPPPFASSILNCELCKSSTAALDNLLRAKFLFISGQRKGKVPHQTLAHIVSQ